LSSSNDNEESMSVGSQTPELDDVGLKRKILIWDPEELKAFEQHKKFHRESFI